MRMNVMITAMDAFLENSDQDGSSGGDGGGAEEGGFSETQIQNLLSACEMATSSIQCSFILLVMCII
eukprot:scaffold16735_cov121-Skeletonema_marinoi.AAC.2